MIEKIMQNLRETSFDFEEFSNPEDPLKYLFPKWKDYYQMKYAICKAIQPKSILEIGVRYGYSAISFLKACPGATYTGIDSDSFISGGVKGAIEWAKEITLPYRSKFIIADSQEMKEFPGGYYSMIHVDGQQDGDGTYHDLELALHQSDWILLDGYFWTKENMLSATYFIAKYQDFIDYALAIPGYAGDLLIKTKSQVKPGWGKSYRSLKYSYDSHYYLNDCGGYDCFLKNNGKGLDERLASVLLLTDPEPGERILDVGSGRGELAYALFEHGAEVTAIDYSEQAISIAENTYGDYIGEKLQFVCGDILKHKFQQKFDKIVAADLVEHIEPENLEKVIKQTMQLLERNGKLIIHTSPNRLYYDYDYAQKKELAKTAGSYLPLNPRTFYEDLMHINEQTPETLEKTLKCFYPRVVVWAANTTDVSRALTQELRFEEICQLNSIYAIASKRIIDRGAIVDTLSQNKLDITKTKLDLQSGTEQIKVTKGERFSIDVKLINKGLEKISSLNPYPVNLAYHYLNVDRSMQLFDGWRTKIPHILKPGQSTNITMELEAPLKEGDFILQITLVQEHCCWLENHQPDIPLEIQIAVNGL